MDEIRISGERRPDVVCELVVRLCDPTTAGGQDRLLFQFRGRVPGQSVGLTAGEVLVPWSDVLAVMTGEELFLVYGTLLLKGMTKGAATKYVHVVAGGAGDWLVESAALHALHKRERP